MEPTQNKSLRILIADDDPDDRMLLTMAFRESKMSHFTEFVKDGQELMDYLALRKGQSSQLPDLILLDLNMPRKDGRVALKEIKEDANFANLTVIIFSTSISEEDKRYTLELGAKDYITKPSGFYEMVTIVKNLGEFVAA